MAAEKLVVSIKEEFSFCSGGVYPLLLSPVEPARVGINPTPTSIIINIFNKLKTSAQLSESMEGFRTAKSKKPISKKT